MDLSIKNLWVVNIGGVEVRITETIFNTWVIMMLLIALAVVVRIKLRGFREIPAGFQNIVEAAVEIFEKFVRDTLGDKLSYVAPWFFMVFAYILTSCLLSTIGIKAPTADWVTTMALSLATFVIMIALGLRHRRGGYVKGLFAPNPVFFPLNLLSELSKPISLSFRLFGNMLSGTIILTLYYGLTPVFVQIGIPAVLHAVFDVVIGALQTYIFVIISLMYIKGAAD